MSSFISPHSDGSRACVSAAPALKSEGPWLSVIERIGRQALVTPQAIAVTWLGETLTYAELDSRANRLARYLILQGVQPGERVGLCVARSPELLIALLAVLKAGAAYVPLDASHPRQRLEFMLADMGASVLVTQTSLASQLPTTGLNCVLLDACQAEVASQSPAPCCVPVSQNDLVYVIYTSGSTGKPKGTLVQHGGLTCYLDWACQIYRVTEGTGSLWHSPLGFDLTVTSIFPPLLTGGKVAIVPEEQGIDALCRALLAEENLSLLKITPAHLELLARQLSPEAAAGRTRALVVGGEALLGETLRFWRTHAPQTRIINEYGPTETVVGCCIHEVTPVDPHSGAMPIGHATPGTRLYLLDPAGQPVPPGEAGELYIGGEQVTLGYLGHEELTAERFLPDPYSSVPQARMYRTGDLVRPQADGALVFLGRQDEQLKVRGYRIEPGEIEAVLNSAPAVRESLIVALPNKSGEARLVAYVVPQASAGTDLATVAEELRPRLRRHLQQSLPPYMTPAAFVFLAEFPLTHNGKIDRRQLPPPGTERPALDTAYLAPRNELEQRLATAWAETLGLERVGVLDNFFELGGDSLQNIRIVARARQAGIELTPGQVFKYPTIAALAGVAKVAVESNAEQGLVTGPLPLTPYFHWFCEQHFLDPQHWNMSLLLTATEPLDAGRLEQALAALVQHHDVLRLRMLPTGDGGWRAELAAEQSGPLVEVIDLTSLPLAEREGARLAAAQRLQAGLNLESGPLLRLGIFRGLPSDGDSSGAGDQLLIATHHLLVDGLSYLVLLEDLQTAYNQLSCGTAIQLPPKTTSFPHWAAQLTQYAHSAAAAQEADYWRQAAGNWPATLPRDFPPAERDNRVATSRMHTEKLSAEETQTLLRDVPAAYNTHINDLLLTALLVTCARWTGQAGLRIDMEGHGREELLPGVDVSRTVAGFTTIFPVELSAGPANLQAELDTQLEQLLIGVKEQMRAIPQHGIGYGLLRYLGADESLRRDLASQPPAELVFNYLGQIDQVLAGSSLFELCDAPRGSEFSPQTHRTYLIEANGCIAEGRLQMDWIYASRVFRAETIERVSAEFMQVLRQLIAHCTSPTAGRNTPADFPLAKLDQTGLDSILAGRRKVAGIYPLSPLQHGMLFHALLAPESGVYYMQLAGTLRGAVDPAALRQAWQNAMNRHAALRTRFVWTGLAEPLQVVEQAVAVPWEEEDWRGITTEEQEWRLQNRIATRRDYLLHEAPLLRLHLLRLADHEYRWLWNFHHLLIDGWSLVSLVEEVLTDYESLRSGGTFAPGSRSTMHDYAAWLAEQNRSAAEAYWRQELAGFTSPTPLPGDRIPHGSSPLPLPPADEQEQGRHLLYLSAEDSAACQEFARTNRVTLNVLFQAAWGWQLASSAQADDVLFGTIVPGRPADLPGAESMLGLLMNTLPVRMKLRREMPLLSWLQALQEQQLAMRQFEWSGLTEIQRCSEIRQAPLLESLISVQGHLAAHGSLAAWGESLGLADFHYIDWNSLPLSLAVEIGPRISILAKFDARRFTQHGMEELLAEFVARVKLLVANPRRTLQELAELYAASRTEQQAHERLERQQSRSEKLVGARRRSVLPPASKGE